MCAQLQRVIERYVSPSLDAPLALDLLGEVPDDASVREAVLRRELLLEVFPGSAAARAVAAVAAKMAR